MNQAARIETPRPFKQDPLPLPAGNLFTRMVTARVIASILKRRPEEVAAQRWPNDRVLAAAYQAKAASNPAMTSVAGWAQELAQKRVAEAVSTLGAAAASVEIMGAGLLLAWDNYGAISVPAFVADATHASFVQEGQPIPVRQFNETPQTLLPYKVASISALTREMMESSNAEALITDVVIKSSALAIDAQFFGTGAATAAAPAGIRYNIAETPPSASTDPFGAVFEDVGSLINVVGAVGGRGPFYLIGSAGRMSSMKGRFDFEGTGDSRMIPVISSAVGGDLICVAAQALASAVDADPDVETVAAGTLVMDTAPTAAGTMGPERSLFQTDTLGIKVRWPVSWVLRDPRGVAWTTPIWK